MPRVAAPLPERSAVSSPRLTPERSRTWPSKILVAPNASLTGDAAVAAAHALHERFGATVEALVVYAPQVPLPIALDRPGFSQCEARDRRDAAFTLRAFREQLRRIMPTRAARANWSLRLAVGDPGATIARRVEEDDVDLVIVGIDQREPLDIRMLGRTAVCAARYATVPLLAAARGPELPTRCVIAFPDGRVHEPTLTAALALAGEGADLSMALPVRHDATGVPFVRADASRAVKTMYVDGDFLTGITKAADELDAGLIAVPVYGEPGAVRSFLPNLAEPLIVSAARSVLVVPAG